jgi:ubiquitin thioesterase OTU1
MSGANHCAGYTKQVMVIYNGVHYDALAIAASPRADQDEDATEYNPRTRRGKMILAAAQQLVRAALASDGYPVS